MTQSSLEGAGGEGELERERMAHCPSRVCISSVHVATCIMYVLCMQTHVHIHVCSVVYVCMCCVCMYVTISTCVCDCQSTQVQAYSVYSQLETGYVGMYVTISMCTSVFYVSASIILYSQLEKGAVENCTSCTVIHWVHAGGVVLKWETN